jgi:hypothetical protein
MSAPSTYSAALRFRRSAARTLRNLSERMRGEPGIDTSLYDKAADSAEQGEPLVIRATSRAEVEELASAFPLVGVARPEIDELSDPQGFPR